MSMLLEQAHTLLANATIERLSRRAMSVYGRIGEQACRRYVDLALVALERDIGSGKRDAVRDAVQTLIDDLAADNLVFADLRFFGLTLRACVQAWLDSTPEATTLQRPIDDWFFELSMVGSMRFLLQREAALQERAAKLELRQLESQLAELQIALTEKTELLEMVRQASTPIAPVVEGILVVPLVGTFDATRAEHLTEKLLQEISRVHARAAILDISGVPVFDTAAAQLIIRLARSVHLLGTEVLLVGMSPQNARTIIALEVDLSGIRTLGTLRDGLAQALVLQRMKIVKVSGPDGP